MYKKMFLLLICFASLKGMETGSLKERLNATWKKHLDSALLKFDLLSKQITPAEYIVTKDSVLDAKYNNQSLTGIMGTDKSLQGLDLLKFDYQCFRDGKKLIWFMGKHEWEAVKPIFEKNPDLLHGFYINTANQDRFFIYHPSFRANALLLDKYYSLLSQKFEVIGDGVAKVKTEITNDEQQSQATKNLLSTHNNDVLPGILLNYGRKSIEDCYMRREVIRRYGRNAPQQIENPSLVLSEKQMQTALGHFEKDKKSAQQWMKEELPKLGYIGLRLFSITHLNNNQTFNAPLKGIARNSYDQKNKPLWETIKL